MYLWGYSTLVFHIRFLVSNHGIRVPEVRVKGRKESRMRGQQTRRALFTIYVNVLTVSSDVSIEGRHWQLLSVRL